MHKILPFFIGFLLLLSCGEVSAQDPQFSQFYAAPLYLNPAFAGGAGQARVGVNYRNQWPSLDARFTTTSAYFDYFFEDYNSGVGLIVTSDREGLAGLKSTSIGLQYAYQLRLTEKLSFRPGVQISFVNRDLNFNKLTFGDQYDETGFISPTTAESFNTNTGINFADISFGGLLYSGDFWIGFSMFHLTEPNQSFVGEASPLPKKSSVHGGYKISLPAKPGRSRGPMQAPRERSLTPTFQYKTQGEFDQLDLGLYLTLEPIVLGTWYRGIPFKTYEGFGNNESAVFLIGISSNNLNIGYSFDYTLSELGIGSGGAHEVSLAYEFPLRSRKIPPKNVRLIPCPKF